MTPKAELIASLEALFGRGNVIELTEANLDEVAARLSGADPVAPDAECRCSRCAAGKEFANRVARVVAPHTLGEMDRRDLRSPGDQLRIEIIATRHSPSHIEFDVDVGVRT